MPAPVPAAPPPASARPWGRAVGALATLAVVFYATYGGANWLAAQHAQVATVAFDWERAIPFLPWTIVPYWSTNVFYAASFLLFGTPRDLDVHVRRLLTAQLVAIAAFVAVPLRFAFERPATGGLPGLLFDLLTGFDRPFNQAPSLHVALTVILWIPYARLLPRWARPALRAWFALVILSVLTTYQHHVVDVPTGLLLGWLAVWLWPDAGRSPIAAWAPSTDPRRVRLARRYAAGAVALAAAATLGGGAVLLLFWPATACAIVAAGYRGLGPGVFQKTADGRMSLAARWLLAPYLVAAGANATLRRRHGVGASPVADGVWIGPLSAAARAGDRSWARVVDLCAEIPAPRGASAWQALPALDLVRVPAETTTAAIAAIEDGRRAGPVLVCCALGLGRSAAAVAAWLIATGRAASPAAAVAAVSHARPGVILDARDLGATGASR